MKYSPAKIGRTFIIRLEQGDVVHEAIEQLARDEGVAAASLVIVGGAENGSRLVVGPADGEARPVDPVTTALAGVHEIAGVGTIFPDEAGQPVLHMHMACGRGDATTTGCVRTGVVVWQVMEAVLVEITDTTGVRRLDAETGFVLLEP